MTKKRPYPKRTTSNTSFFAKKEIGSVNTEPPLQKRINEIQKDFILGFKKEYGLDLTPGSVDSTQELQKRIDEIQKDFVWGFKEKYGLDLTQSSADSTQPMEDAEEVSEGMDLSYQ